MTTASLFSRTTTVLALVTALCGVACSKDPERAKIEYLARGDADVKAGNTDAAIIEYRNAAQQDPRFADAYSRLAAAYLSKGDGGSALHAATAAADLLPDSAEAQLAAGHLLLLAMRFDEAKARA